MNLLNENKIDNTNVTLGSVNILASADYIGGSLLNITHGFKELQCDTNTTASESANSGRSRISSIFHTFAKVFDLSVVKLPIFIAFELSALLQCPGIMLSSVFIVPHAKEQGINPDRVALIVTIYSAVDLFSRIVIAVISDNRFVRRSTLVAIASLVLGLSAHLLRFYNTFTSLVVYAVVLGLVSGAYLSLFAVIIVDFMSIDRLQSVLGFTALFQGCAVACTYYVAGKNLFCSLININGPQEHALFVYTIQQPFGKLAAEV